MAKDRRPPPPLYVRLCFPMKPHVRLWAVTGWLVGLSKFYVKNLYLRVTFLWTPKSAVLVAAGSIAAFVAVWFTAVFVAAAGFPAELLSSSDSKQDVAS